MTTRFKGRRADEPAVEISGGGATKKALAVSGGLDVGGGATVRGDVTIAGDLEHTGTNVGFYSATPVDQAAHIADPTGGLTNDAEARTAIDAILVVLEELGLTASA